MKTNEIQFGGKSYVCRIVEANDGEELLIAPTTLLDALQPCSFDDETKVSPAKKLKVSTTRFSTSPTRKAFSFPKTN